MLAWMLTCHSSLTQLVQSALMAGTSVLCGDGFDDCAILLRLVYDCFATGVSIHFQTGQHLIGSNATCFYLR
jgi:hypothetical protein